MTTKKLTEESPPCPAQPILKVLSGKWKPEIFRSALNGPLRFNTLLREIDGINKQALSVALKELEKADLLEKVVIKQKPLHIEYYMTENGKSLITFLKQLEDLS